MKAFGSWGIFTTRSLARITHRTGCAAGAALAVMGACWAASPSAASANESEELIGLRIEGTDPGCVIGAFDHRGTVFQRTYGLANLNAGTPVDASTRFELGALSRTDAAASRWPLPVPSPTDAQNWEL